MKNAELRFVSLLQDGSRDVVGLRLRVYLDRRESSAVNAVISGIDLAQTNLSAADVLSRPGALLRCVAPHVQNALDDGRLPLADLKDVIEVRVNGDDLRSELKSTDDSLSVELNQRHTRRERERFESRNVESLSVANFAGFCASQTLHIQDLTVLVGANGSGKSGMLTVMDLVAALASGRDTKSLVRPGWQNVGCDERTTLKIELSQPKTVGGGSHPPIIYEATIEDRDSDAAIVLESLSDGPNSTLLKRPETMWGIVYTAQALLSGKEVSAQIASPYNWRTSALSWFRDDSVFPKSQPIAGALSDIAVYRGWQFGGAKTMRRVIHRDDINGRLNAAGTNLPEVLASLLSNGEIANQLNKALREVLPGEVTLSVSGQHSMEATIRIALDGAELTLGQLSDGTLQWLQLLSILKSPNRASLIALDEPELGLHPDCVAALGNLLCDVAEDGRSRLVVATHSAALLDVFEARGHSGGLRVFERDQGGVRITTPTAQQLAIWCDETTTLGEAWLRGAFGGGRW